MKIKEEDVLAVYVGSQVYCMRCLARADIAEVDPKDYIFEDEMEWRGEIVFCDCEDHVGPRRLN